MHFAPPPAPHPTTDEPRLGMYATLHALIREAGAHITVADIDDDATWDADTHTLTLRADAGHDGHTYALAEFCRYVGVGPAFSRFIDTEPERYLYAVP